MIMIHVISFHNTNINSYITQVSI